MRRPFYFSLALLALGASSAFAQLNMRAEAFVGEPFGVGRVMISASPQALPRPLGLDGLGLQEKNGRIFYPAMHNDNTKGEIVKDVVKMTPLLRGGPIREQIGGILQNVMDQPPGTTIYFLFRGAGPLDITLEADRSYRTVVRPMNNPHAWRALMGLWWKDYTISPGFLQTKPDYPPLLDNFLVSTLSRRFGLALPEKKQMNWREELAEEVGFVLGTENIRIAMQQDRILGTNDLGQQANLALPPMPPQYPFTLKPGDVKTEPMASHVPMECFYIRFGSFNNFLWIQDTLKKWGGDAQNLISSRGLDLQMNKQIEEQLILKQSALSRMLGPTVISDVAIIGTDLYSREGSAMGLLFQARSSAAVGADFKGKRTERVKKGGVTEQKLKIAGKTVSYISSPDGKVRSYYAIDGAYHFVTTSKTLAQRFLQAGQNIGSLGQSDEFRYARKVMPLDREDTIFVYLSSEFFRNLVTPHYRIEMIRRLQSSADIDLVQLAKLMAATEGLPGATIEELKASGTLPPEFGPRPDGSQTVIKQGYVFDSIRGHRGGFIPIPDMPIPRVTAAEAEAYHRFTRYYAERIGRLEPTMIGVKRHDLENGIERVVVDAHMGPLGSKFHDYLAQYAGPAEKMQLAPVPGDLAAGQLVMKDKHLFAGVHDFGPPAAMIHGQMSLLAGIRDILVGYIGADGPMPRLENIEWLVNTPARVTGRFVRGGSVVPPAIYRGSWKQFTLYSLHQEVINFVLPRLQWTPAPRPAQLRLRVVDPHGRRAEEFLNSMGFARTRETSRGNLRLLHALEQQMHIPSANCLEAAEFLLGAKLIDPLGGQFLYQKRPDGSGRWTTSTLINDPGGKRSPLSVKAPPGYVAPPLTWFRGLDLDATLVPGTLSAHAEVIMASPPKPEPKKKK